MKLEITFYNTSVITDNLRCIKTSLAWLQISENTCLLHHTSHISVFPAAFVMYSYHLTVLVFCCQMQQHGQQEDLIHRHTDTHGQQEDLIHRHTDTHGQQEDLIHRHTDTHRRTRTTGGPNTQTHMDTHRHTWTTGGPNTQTHRHTQTHMDNRRT